MSDARISRRICRIGEKGGSHESRANESSNFGLNPARKAWHAAASNRLRWRQFVVLRELHYVRSYERYTHSRSKRATTELVDRHSLYNAQTISTGYARTCQIRISLKTPPFSANYSHASIRFAALSQCDNRRQHSLRPRLSQTFFQRLHQNWWYPIVCSSDRESVHLPMPLARMKTL